MLVIVVLLLVSFPLYSQPTPPSPPVPPSVPTVSAPRVSPPAKNKADETTPRKSAKAASSGELSALLPLLGLDGESSLLQKIRGNGVDSDRDERLESLLEKALSRQQSTPSIEPSLEPSLEPVSLVRCLVEGNDLLPSFGSSLTASLASDGTFLVTGDRFLVLSGMRRRETVYLLCRKTSGGYYLSVDVSQEQENPASFFWRLSRKSPVAGERIGELVLFRSASPDLAFDVLFRITSSSVKDTSVR